MMGPLKDRKKAIDSWLAKLNTFNREGVSLAPRLAAFLNTDTPIDDMLLELDRLRAETRAGRFDPANDMQRELEFKRFHDELRHSSGKTLPFEEVYALFSSLEWLPDLPAVSVQPSPEHMASAKRAAYEAEGLLGFLRRFRASTTRPIVVIGNDKAQLAGGGYGRHWVVEPLEDILVPDFNVAYNRVPSHASMRLTTPAAFDKGFVRVMDVRAPHVVIVDGAAPGKSDGVVRFSKAIRGYANWLAAFNKLRGGGVEGGYRQKSLLPPDHLRELAGWHEFMAAVEQMRPWVSPGEAYDVRLWSPHPTEQALMGDVLAQWPTGDISGDQPLVVLANPIVYLPERMPPGSLPEYMYVTKPYALDSADRDLLKMLAPAGLDSTTRWGDADDNAAGPIGSINPCLTKIGFGRFGIERRVFGPSMDTFFYSIKAEIRRCIHGVVQSK
ncbi:MAG: hypothetical protein FJ319_11330 [SAR202 cluster bacterium]|nr:hypothetical protein [SAR202 cluster bacterium]